MRIHIVTDTGSSATDVIHYAKLVGQLMQNHNNLVGYIHPTVPGRWMVVAYQSESFMAIGADGHILTFTLEREEDGEFYCFKEVWIRMVWMMEDLA